MITADTALLAPPRASAEQAIAYIIRRGSVYTPQDISTIVGYYWRYCMPVGIDPLLAIAQCIHETSELDPATGKWLPLSTWWAQRPNRNPAGLGVTGEESTTPPADKKGWIADTRTQPPTWRKGLAFSSWDESSRAHIGRLLAYALPEGGERDAQRELISFSLGIRPLAKKMRGTAPTLKSLGAKYNPTGQGWAYPGDNYGNKIAEMARAIAVTNP